MSATGFSALASLPCRGFGGPRRRRGAATRDSERVDAVRAIDRGCRAASGCRASAQVGHASQTQSLANLAEALAEPCEDTEPCEDMHFKLDFARLKR